MFTPKPYQDEGTTFLTGRRRAILADDTGLGKSMQMLRAAQKRTLILCPAIGRVSWSEQCYIWSKASATLYPEILKDDHATLVINYEYLSDKQNARKVLDDLATKAPRFDNVIFDEAHYLKSHTSQRTKSVYGEALDLKNCVASFGEAKWLATATLTINNASEVYTHLRAIFPDILQEFQGGWHSYVEAGFEAFRDQVCHTKQTPYGVKILGNKKPEVARLVALMEPHVMHRTKAQVLTQLKPIECHALSLGTATDFQNVTSLDNEISDDELRVLLETPKTVTEREELGLDKARLLTPWVESFLLEPTKKLIIFAHHRSVIAQLEKDLSRFNPVKINGGTSLAQNAQAVQRFNQDAACRVFIGQNQAASTSITLTAASDVVMLEPDWTPAVNYQAISRAHRIGQMYNVIAYFVLIPGTMDAKIVKALRRKTSDCAQTFASGVIGTA